MNLTPTSGGLLLAVLGPITLHFLGQWGFSQTCSSEVVQLVPVVAGSAIAWLHQWKSGHQNIFGGKV